MGGFYLVPSAPEYRIIPWNQRPSQDGSDDLAPDMKRGDFVPIMGVADFDRGSVVEADADFGLLDIVPSAPQIPDEFRPGVRVQPPLDLDELFRRHQQPFVLFLPPPFLPGIGYGIGLPFIGIGLVFAIVILLYVFARRDSPAEVDLVEKHPGLGRDTHLLRKHADAHPQDVDDGALFDRPVEPVLAAAPGHRCGSCSASCTNTSAS